MGLFRTSDGIISQAMPLTAAMIASIDQRPAWLFENQSGTLGTNLNSSVIYCGTMPADGTGSISVILPGVSSTGVFSLQVTNGGTEYVTANNVATTSDTGNGSGLTLDIVATPATFSGPVGGDGDYTIGAIDTFVPALAGASGTIDSITTIGAPTALTLIQGGIGYDETLPYTYATTVSPTGGTGLTISVTGASGAAASFTGPTGGNGRYIDPLNTYFTQVTSFSPAGAVGTIDSAGFPGGPGFGNPTSITITGGLDSYADGTVVEILQVLDDGGSGSIFGNYLTDIMYPTSQPSGSNILYGVQNPMSGDIPQVGNFLKSEFQGTPGSSKFPAGTYITAVSESGGVYTLTLSANTTGSFSGSFGDDSLIIYKNVGYGSTFTVVAGTPASITTFAIDNPGSGYDVGDVVSPTLIGAGTPASFSVATLSTTGNPATVTLAGIGGYTVGQEVEIQQTGATGSKVAIVESDNPVVSATVGNNAGLNYSVGDIITIAQAGSDLNATLVVSKRALKPLVSQAVTFTGLQSGSILPVSVDYVTAVGGGTGADPVTVANFIVGR